MTTDEIVAPRPKSSARSRGEAAAANSNQQLQQRHLIVKALQTLGHERFAQWLDFVRKFYTEAGERINYEQAVSPSPFQPPSFDRLNQTAAEEDTDHGEDGEDEFRHELTLVTRCTVAREQASGSNCKLLILKPRGVSATHRGLVLWCSDASTGSSLQRAPRGSSKWETPLL